MSFAFFHTGVRVQVEELRRGNRAVAKPREADCTPTSSHGERAKSVPSRRNVDDVGLVRPLDGTVTASVPGRRAEVRVERSGESPRQPLMYLLKRAFRCTASTVRTGTGTRGGAEPLDERPVDSFSTSRAGRR